MIQYTKEMKMHKSTKIRRVMDTKEALDYLHQIIDQLAPHDAEPGESLVPPAENIRKLKISLKRDRESNQVSLKLKINYFKDLVEQSAEIIQEKALPFEIPDYVSLKKSMKRSFKEIFQSIAKGSLPSGEAVASFTRDAGLMVTFPGRGEEHYNEFRHRCTQLKQAFEKGDLAECRALASELNSMKTECHSDHK
jgi:XXXCH domain-containing protein